MAITKVDVKKKLFSGGDANPSAKVNQAHQRITTNARPTRQSRSQKSVGTVNLEKMSSASFDKLIGEGPSPSIITTNKDLKLSKKTEEKIRMQMLLSINANVLDADEVHIDEATPDIDDAAEVKDTNSRQEDEGAKSKEVQISKRSEKGAKGKETLDAELCDKGRQNVQQSQLSDKETTANKGDGTVSNDDIGNSRPLEDLDITLPMYATVSSQTECCYILCSCNNCKDLVKKFSTFINRGYSTDDCAQRQVRNTLVQGTNESVSSLYFSNKEDEVELVPLFKGTLVKISITSKGKLKALDRKMEATPRDYVYEIMDALYDSKVMANMTAAGRTKGSIPMQKAVKDSILIYLQNKFEDITPQVINDHINNKCYAERRKLWGKDEEGVRKPLQKNIKKKIEGAEQEEGAKTKRMEQEVDRSKKKKKMVQKKHEKSVRGESKEKSHARKLKSRTPEKAKCKRKKDSSEREEDKKKTIHNETKCPYSPAHSKKLSHEGRPITGGKRPRSLEEIMRINAESQSDDDDYLEVKRRKGKESKNTNKYMTAKKLTKLCYSPEFQKNLHSSTPYSNRPEGDEKYESSDEDDDTQKDDGSTDSTEADDDSSDD